MIDSALQSIANTVRSEVIEFAEGKDEDGFYMGGIIFTETLRKICVKLNGDGTYYLYLFQTKPKRYRRFFGVNIAKVVELIGS